MFYITKDVHETLDYVFIRPVTTDLIVGGSIVIEQPPTATINVISSNLNLSEVTDEDGNTYPIGSAIILWVSGGTVGTTESLRLQYSTVGGRILDEEISFRVVEAY
jgi:hypothetical protein